MAAIQAGGRGLQRVDWSFHSPTYRALDFAFEVRTTDPVLGGLIEEIFASFARPSTDAAPDILYSMLEAPSRRQEIYADGDLVLTTDDPGRLVPKLIWHINRQVIARNRERVLLHAGGVARDGRAVLLPGPQEAGKTTLVAGLIRAGLDYLSDEAIAVDPEQLVVEGYAKPLSVDRGSWDVLANLAPSASHEAYLSRQWQVHPSRIAGGATVRSATPELVVIPRYAAEQQTRLEPASRAQTLRVLAQQTFANGPSQRRSLDVLGRLVRESKCYRLTVQDLDTACAAVGDLLL